MLHQGISINEQVVVQTRPSHKLRVEGKCTALIRSESKEAKLAATHSDVRLHFCNYLDISYIIYNSTVLCCINVIHVL
jgi:hypothetical protein